MFTYVCTLKPSSLISTSFVFYADLSLSASHAVKDNFEKPAKVVSVNCRESQIARKRKFPGPAGVLPKLVRNDVVNYTMLLCKWSSHVVPQY